jgi:hypothetical protein
LYFTTENARCIFVPSKNSNCKSDQFSNYKKLKAMKQHLINRLFLWAFILLYSTGVADAQGWRSSFIISSTSGPFYEDGSNILDIHTSISNNENGLVIVNFSDDNKNYHFAEYGLQGISYVNTHSAFWLENNAWNHFASDLLALTDESLLVLEHRGPYNGGNHGIFLSKFDYLYNAPIFAVPTQIVWHKPLLDDPNKNIISVNMHKTSANELMILGNSNTVSDAKWNPVLIKTDIVGNVLWDKTLNDANDAQAIQLIDAADGGFYVLKSVTPNVNLLKKEAWLTKVNANGEVLWDKNLSENTNDFAGNIQKSSDGSLLIAGVSETAGRTFLIKTDVDGEVLWRKDFGVFGPIVKVLEHNNGDIALVSNYNDDILIQKIAADGSPIWEKTYNLSSNRKSYAYTASIAFDGGYLVGGKVIGESPNNLPLAFLFKTDANGIVKPSIISGNVQKDLNLNCQQDATETPLENWIVTAFKDSTHIFYGSTNTEGNYAIECDTGDYVVTLSLPSPVWQVCDNNIALHVGYIDTALVNFSVNTVVDCAYMTVEHNAHSMRPCDTTQIYVNYCNLGTISGQNASVEISIDPLLTFVSSTIPLASNVNNLLTFDLGDVASLDCGNFVIDVAVACNFDTGLVACSQAHIFPDDNCLPMTGAIIVVSGQCVGDSVRFDIKNIGTDPSQLLEYIVIEDAVLLRQGNFQLSPTEHMEVTQLANGATFHLMAQQEPGIIGNNPVISGVEACVGSSSAVVSSGFFNQFSQSDAASTISDFCLPVTNSYDPNDKQAAPTGFGFEHNIFANTDLEYKIRFQNTGTDTAFRVILLDTLSQFLNPASFQLGASSHPCRFELEENGVLRFTFSTIQLPHAAINEAASNGFVTFRIKQKENNPIGTQINNSAGIYFDYNAPIATNTVLHTIHEPLIKVTSFVQEADAPKVNFTAYPNPFVNQIQFEIQGNETIDAQLNLFDIAGKTLRTVPFSNNTALLTRGNLPAGVYFFGINGEKGEKIGSGKIVVE